MLPDISRQNPNGTRVNGSHHNGTHHIGGTQSVNPITQLDHRLTTWVNTKSEQLFRSLEEFPTFDGQLLTSEEAITQAATDYGHLVHHRPLAVLYPASAEDVVTMIRYARANGIAVAARGQGHSSFGQSQAKNGIVIDMSSLASIRSVSHNEIEVDAGITWLDLLRTTVAQGLTPPVVPDYLSLSVGGVLSVGGLGSQSPLHGATLDHVLELEVVTGKGDLVRCSPHSKVDLFDAIRGGLGQFGIITKARLKLIPAPRMTRLYHLDYDDLAAFLNDMQTLLDDQRFDTMQGFVFANEYANGGANEKSRWRFQLEVNKYLHQENGLGDSPVNDKTPNDATLLKGLSFIPESVTVVEQNYFTGDARCPGYLDRVEAFVPIMQELGLWNVPHPWINLFVPSKTALQTISEWLESTSPEDVGQGVMSIYPYDRTVFSSQFLRLPDTLHFFLFALLRNSTPATTEQNEKLLQRNRLLFEEARAVGGMRYPVDSVAMSAQDWQAHFGASWELFTMFKQFYDPDRLLSPGQGIFPHNERVTVPAQPVFQRVENEFARF